MIINFIRCCLSIENSPRVHLNGRTSGTLACQVLLITLRCRDCRGLQRYDGCSLGDFSFLLTAPTIEIERSQASEQAIQRSDYGLRGCLRCYWISGFENVYCCLTA